MPHDSAADKPEEALDAGVPSTDDAPGDDGKKAKAASGFIKVDIVEEYNKV